MANNGATSTYTAPSETSDGNRSGASASDPANLNIGFSDNPPPRFQRDVNAEKSGASNVKATSKPTTKESARKRPSVQTAIGDYRESIKGLVQMAAAPLVPKAPADACTLIAYAEPLANAVQKVAEHDERIAAILEKLTEVGPYGELVMIVATMGAQIAVNHKQLSAGILGTVEPEDLIATVTGTKRKGSETDDD